MFISYSSRDVALARSLQHILESSLGFRVWRDERAIERDWSREIAQGLVDSEALVLVWSRAAVESRWVKNEWLTARALGRPIIPLLVEGAPSLPRPLENVQGLKTAGNSIDPHALGTRIDAQLRAPVSYDFTVRPPNTYLPLNPNPQFVGRETDLVDLYLALIGNLNKIGVRAVGSIGMGGIGKTQLVVEFAYRFAFAFDGVYWIDATDPAEWVERFVALARNELRLSRDAASGSDAASAPTSDLELLRALRDYCTAHPQLCLVLDNIQEPERLNDSESLLGIAPLNLGCNLLFTTRRQFELPGVLSHQVGVLPAREAYEVLSEARLPSDEKEAEHARAICAALGYLPLALVLAAAYLRRYPTFTFAAYRDRLTDNRLETVDVQNLSEAQLATRHLAVVRATLENQWEALESDDARHVFRLAGLMREGSVIPKARLGLLAGITQESGALVRPLDDACQSLEDLSLADSADNGAALRLHPLVHDFAADQVNDAENERAEAAAKLAAAYAEVGRVDRENAERGPTAVIEDVVLGIEWNGKPRTRDALLGLRRLLDAESAGLYRFSSPARPAFFLQQFANRAETMGLPALAEEARRRLLERQLPYFAQLWRTQRNSPQLVRTLPGHTDWVNDVALTPDDSRLVTASEDSTLRVWDLETGRLIEVLAGHEGGVGSVAVLADGVRAVTSGADGTIRIWNLATGEQIREIRAHEDEVTACAVDPQHARALTSGRDGPVRVWELDNPAKPLDFCRLDGGASALAFMPDGTHILFADFSAPPGGGLLENRGWLELWSFPSRKRVWRQEAHLYVIDAIVVRDDGGLIATAGRDGRVRLWDPSNAELRHELAVDDPGGLALFDEGRRLVVGSERSIRIGNTENGEFTRRLEGHSGSLRAAAVARDAQTLVTGAADNTARIWRLDAISHSAPPRNDGHSDAVTTAVALEHIAVTGDIRGNLRLWDTDTGELLASTTKFGMRKNGLVADNGHLVVTSAADLEGGSIEAFDLARRVEYTVWLTEGRVEFLQLNEDETILVVAGGGGAEVDVIDVGGPTGLRGTGRFLRALSAPERTHWVDGVAMTPDAALIALAASGSFGGDSALYLFDVGTGDVLGRCVGVGEHIQQLTISADGRLVTFGSVRGTFGLWEPSRGERPTILARELGRDPKLASLEDGSAVVTAANDVRVWDVETGKVRRMLEGHPGIWQLIVRSEREVVTAADDWTITLWDVQDGVEIATLALDDEAREVAIAPNGTTLVVGDGGGDVYAFRLVRGENE